ncbi:MAG: hypothetical protein ACK4YV_12865 [Emticicia sp.]
MFCLITIDVNHGRTCIRIEEVVYLSGVENYTKSYRKYGKKIVSYAKNPRNTIN